MSSSLRQGGKLRLKFNCNSIELASVQAGLPACPSVVDRRPHTLLRHAIRGPCRTDYGPLRRAITSTVAPAATVGELPPAFSGLSQTAFGRVDTLRKPCRSASFRKTYGFAARADASLRGFHHPAPSGLFWLLQPLALAQAHSSEPSFHWVARDPANWVRFSKMIKIEKQPHAK